MNLPLLTLLYPLRVLSPNFTGKEVGNMSRNRPKVLSSKLEHFPSQSITACTRKKENRKILGPAETTSVYLFSFVSSIKAVL